MQNFLAGQDITLTIDVSDVGMEISGIEYDVIDADGVIVVARSVIAGVTSLTTEVVIVVPALSNALPVGATIAARSITLYITGTGLAAGITAKSVTYALVTQDRLPVPGVSFQSLVSAELVANDLIGIDSWLTSADQQKVAALMEARNRLVRLRYSWTPEDFQNRMSSTVELNEYWFESMTESEWLSMDQRFKTALKRAQVIEADSILKVDPDGDYRSAGVTSITIGESSKSFLSTRSAKAPLCRAAMSTLSRFLAAPGLTRS